MRKMYFPWVFILVSLFLIVGCGEDNDDEIIPKYLVDSELFTPALPNTAENIKSFLAPFGMTELTAKVKYDIQIHRITYKTLFEGDSILVSGVVASPMANDKKETFPVMSYQHGTLFRKADAPSVNTANEFMCWLASTGLVVIIPDYIGFGASSFNFHPYMHKQYTINAVLDMIRASKEFIKIEKPCEINDKLFLLGYSQGGGATVAALSAIENLPANSDLKVTASAAGGGAYDMKGFREWIMNQQRYDKPSYLAYLLESYLKYTDLDIDYNLVFKDKYAQLIPGLIDGIKSDDAINSAFDSYAVSGLFHNDFQNNATFATNPVYASMRKAFDDNKVTGWAIQSSLSLYYGTTDVWVPGDQTMVLFQQFQDKGVGAKVRMRPLVGMNHITAFPTTIQESLDWFSGF